MEKKSIVSKPKKAYISLKKKSGVNFQKKTKESKNKINYIANPAKKEKEPLLLVLKGITKELNIQILLNNKDTAKKPTPTRIAKTLDSVKNCAKSIIFLLLGIRSNGKKSLSSK